MFQRGGGLVVCRATLQRRHQKSAASSASKRRQWGGSSDAADEDGHTGTTAFLTLQGSREKSSAYRYAAQEVHQTENYMAPGSDARADEYMRM